MKIAILGAPGAGKTVFAEDLRRLMAADMGFDFAIVDEYVHELKMTTGLAYDSFGNHVDDMQVVFKRRENELMYQDEDWDIITVGTVLDSIAHCFIREEDAAHNPRELGLQNERLRTIAATFGLLYTDTWDYDYAFYLPYKGDDPYNRLIDKALRELLSTYAPPVLSFKPQVNDDEKAQTAFKAIVALEADSIPETPGRGVRPGSEDGEIDGDSSESMPDVLEQGRDVDHA